jgi:hypothetical protein
MKPKPKIDPKGGAAAPELCEICDQLPEEGEGRYKCIKCKQIVCSECSYNCGQYGMYVICDDCVCGMTPRQRKTWGVIGD